MNLKVTNGYWAFIIDNSHIEKLKSFIIYHWETANIITVLLYPSLFSILCVFLFTCMLWTGKLCNLIHVFILGPLNG